MKALTFQRWVAIILVLGMLSNFVLPVQAQGISDEIPAFSEPTIISQPVIPAESRPVRDSGVPVKPCIPAPVVEQTPIHVMAVLSFDNDLSAFASEVLERMQQGSRTNPQLRVTLLVDQDGNGDTRVVQIHKGVVHTLPNIPWAPGVDELDTANLDTLSKFLIWAQTEHPSTKRIVTLMGHGVGMAPELAAEPAPLSIVPLPQGRGNSLWDVNSGTYLSTPELGRALSAATNQGQTPFDLLFLDQCFGGNLDVLYEIRNSAEVFIASPNYAWAAFAYDRYLPQLTMEKSNSEIAQMIIEQYEADLDNTHPNAIFWVEGSQIMTLGNAVTALGDALQASLATDPQTESLILQAAMQGQFVDTTVCLGDLRLCPPDEMVGLGSFARNLKAGFPGDSAVAAAAEDILNELTQVHGLYRVGRPWLRPALTWGYTDTLTILAPLTRTLNTPLSWRHTIYTSTAPLTVYLAGSPTQTMVIPMALAFATEGRWDDFISSWYTVTTATVGSSCAAMPPVAYDVQPPSLALFLVALGGVNDIQLVWNPVDSMNINEFRVWRAISGTMEFEPITVTTDLNYRDVDPNLVPGVSYCYRVDGLWPGGMMAVASNEDCTVFGQLAVGATYSWGNTGDEVILPINIRNAEGLHIGAADFWLDFDPRVILPTAVTHTAMTLGYTWHYAITTTETTGRVRISTTTYPGEETELHGNGGLFWISARVVGSEGMSSTLDLKEYIRGVGGSAIYLPDNVVTPTRMVLRDGIFRVGDEFRLGDMTGTGEVNSADAYMALQAAARILTPTVEQLQAGDINGNETVDVADAAMILYYAPHRLWPIPGLESKKAALITVPVQLSMDAVTVAPGQIVDVPVRAKDLVVWTGADMAFKFNPAYLKVLDVQKVELGAQAVISYWVTGSLLKVEMAQPDGISGSGMLYKIRFQVLSETPIGKMLPVVWVKSSLNDLYGRDYEASALNRPIVTQNGMVNVNLYQVYLPLVFKKARLGKTALSEKAAAAESVASGDWFSSVQADIQRSEYNLSRVDGNLKGEHQAPNRANDLRTYFTASGIRLTSRSEAGWNLELSPGQPVGMPVIEGNQARYEDETAGMTFRYTNDESGVRQQIVLVNPAAVVMNWKSDLQGSLAVDGAAEFKSMDGVVQLRYGEMQARDAADHSLPVRLEFTAGQLQWVVEAEGAAYPVVLTALLTSPAGQQRTAVKSVAPSAGLADWTFTGDQSGENLGIGMGTADDVNGDGYCDVLVSAWLYDNGQMDEGRVYLFYGSETGLGTTPVWTTESNQAEARMGFWAYSAGDVNKDGYSDVIIGAHLYDNGETDEGRVFVFYGAATGLKATADWTAESNNAGAIFGVAAEGAGDVNGDGYDDVIVGAADYSHGESKEGAAYVYYGSSTGLKSTPVWKVESNQAGAAFGYTARPAGDVNKDGYDDVLVGAFYYSNGENREGAAFVYYGSSTGLKLTADWQIECNQSDCYMGMNGGPAGDVNHDGYDDVLVSSNRYDGGQENEGRVQLFLGTAAGLQSTAAWAFESNDPWAEMGSSSTAGDFNGDGYDDVIVGSGPYDGAAGSQSGQAWMFFGSALGLSQTANWTIEGTQTGEWKGFRVADAGDVNRDGYDDVLVSSVHYNGSQSDSGKVTLYYGTATLPPDEDETADWTFTGDQSGENLGIGMGTAGDVNGDGYCDVLVSAWLYDNGLMDEGRVYLFYGSATGLGTTPVWTTESNQAEARMGFWAYSAGDVNKDGYSDVIIGAHLYDNGETDEGRVFVFYGAATGLKATADWTAESNNAGAIFGVAAEGAGDVNGDGYDDVIVGAADYSHGESKEGAAYVYYGSSTGLKSTPVWKVESNQAGAAFGYTARPAGDVNKDGYDDVLVGAFYYSNGENREGAAFVYYGSSTGLKLTADWQIECNQSDCYMGMNGGPAGDVNHDGYDDVLVSSNRYDGGQENEGRVQLFLGTAAGLQSTAAWAFESNDPWAEMGSSSTAGDFNGDGYDDVIVGSGPYDGAAGSQSGQAWMFFGSALGLSQTANWTIEGTQTGEWKGFRVADAGDVDGDGYDDVLVSSVHYNGSQSDSGKVTLYYGKPYQPLAENPQVIDGDQADSYFGYRLEGAGDVNKDGYDDVIVGALWYDNGQTNEGRAYIYYGSARGLQKTPAWIVESNQANADFGQSVDSAGDVNHDGYADVVVGATRYDNGQMDEGAAFVYYGSAQGVHSTPDVILDSNQDSSNFGNSVAGVGDVNKDGYEDVLVSANVYSGGISQSGKVYLYYGSAAGLNSTPAWSKEGDRVLAGLGSMINAAGDVNRDGYADVIIGAESYAYNGVMNSGVAYVYYGSATGLKSVADWTASPLGYDDCFGSIANTAGDVNGDGYDDVIAGGRRYDNGEMDEGIVFVYYGSATGLSTTPAWSMESNQSNSAFAIAGGAAGDMNKDGYDDLVLGPYWYDHGQTDEGEVWIYYGAAQGLKATPDLVIESDQSGASLGEEAEDVGDINGDGYADVVVGASRYSTTQGKVGRIYVLYGQAPRFSSWNPGTMEGPQANISLSQVVNAGEGHVDVLVNFPYYIHS